jgi:cyclopropane fatty-acyl-phospholipid synthase-like methyltransferase
MSDLSRGSSSSPATNGGDFDSMYQGKPPWDIGRPQPVFATLAGAGIIRGKVLDAGCGTGEHVLMLAERGLDVLGIDASARAITQAQRKAAERGLPARFQVADALRLDDLGEQFDTVIDNGLFHVFDDDGRRRYIDALAAAVRPGGRYLMCCFSDRQPGDWGPRRVSQEEIRSAFARGWRIDSIEETQMQTNLDPPQVEGWLARITRL